MTASPDLFNLIKSLTPSEKRYFKVFASRHVIGTKNNYEKLFDAIDALPNDQPYDEALLKEFLKKKQWGKNLAVEKSFLEDMLLKALRNYYAEKTVEGKLQNLVTNIGLLFDKGLIDAAKKTLEKAFEEAHEQSDLITLIKLYQYKLYLTGVTFTPAEMKQADKDFEAENDILKLLDTERRTYHASRKIFNQYLAGNLAIDPDERQKWVKELDDTERQMPFTRRGQLNNLKSKAVLLETENRREEALEIFKEIIKLREEHGKKLNEPVRQLIQELGNYLHCLFSLARFKEFEGIINKIEALPLETAVDKAYAFRVCAQYRLVYCLNNKNDGDTFKDIIKDAEKGLKIYSGLLDPDKVMGIHFNICALYFKEHRYDEAIGSINQTYTFIGRDEKLKTVVRDLKFMEAAAHISLKNYELVDYHLRNLERWLRENELNNDFTALLIKGLKKMMQPDVDQNIIGQPAYANCPTELEMIKEILGWWWPKNVVSHV